MQILARMDAGDHPYHLLLRFLLLLLLLLSRLLLLPAQAHRRKPEIRSNSGAVPDR